MTVLGGVIWTNLLYCPNAAAMRWPRSSEVLGALRRIERDAGFGDWHFAVFNLSSGGGLLILTVQVNGDRIQHQAYGRGKLFISVNFCLLESAKIKKKLSVNARL